MLWERAMPAIFSFELDKQRIAGMARSYAAPNSSLITMALSLPSVAR